MVEAERLDHIKEYYFSLKLKEIAQLIASGKDIINLGIGSPDLPPHPVVMEEMAYQSVHGSHQYQNYWGLPELRQAMIDFYEKYYHVSLSMDQIIPLIGSKEGIMHISMAFLNPGDTVLIPNPGYPTYKSVSHLVNARIVEYKLKASQGWLPDINELNKLLSHKPKMMWVNYVNMPTGKVASDEALKQIVQWAIQNHVILINDNPYSLLLNKHPNSILQFSTPSDHVLELNSLSKSFNMAGWRVGMLAGNPDLIQSVMKVKSNMDSGMFYGIQKAATKALKLEEDWFTQLNTIYEKRREMVWEICDLLSLKYDKNTAGMFVFAKIETHENDIEFTDRLLYEKDIFLTPGSLFGSEGKNYVRISLCANEKQLAQALKRIKK